MSYLEKSKNANIIANILAKTDSSDRGELLNEVAIKLVIKTQFYTAKIIAKCAGEYGFKSKNEDKKGATK